MGVKADACAELYSTAHARVAEYAKALYPWANVKDGKGAVEAALREEAPALIAQWYQAFRPEELPAYLERLKQRNEYNAG